MERTDDPRGYLETEARIIAENDTHVVIAHRVEKAALRRNLPLLAALADLVPSRVSKMLTNKS
jgi:hypothetical protein